MPLLTFDTKQNEIKYIFIWRLQRKGIFITLGLIEIICFHLIACDRYQNMTHNTRLISIFSLGIEISFVRIFFCYRSFSLSFLSKIDCCFNTMLVFCTRHELALLILCSLFDRFVRFVNILQFKAKFRAKL